MRSSRRPGVYIEVGPQQRPLHKEDTTGGFSQGREDIWMRRCLLEIDKMIEYVGEGDSERESEVRGRKEGRSNDP